MSLINNQSFASKMQELIDEHREGLSTEFVRVSMGLCQAEYNHPSSDRILVRCFIRHTRIHEYAGALLAQSIPQRIKPIVTTSHTRLCRMDKVSFSRIKKRIKINGDVEWDAWWDDEDYDDGPSGPYFSEDQMIELDLGDLEKLGRVTVVKIEVVK